MNWSLALRKDQTMKRKKHTEEQIIRRRDDRIDKQSSAVRNFSYGQLPMSALPPKANQISISCDAKNSVILCDLPGSLKS
jgi:hypothetical protein